MKCEEREDEGSEGEGEDSGDWRLEIGCPAEGPRHVMWQLLGGPC